MRFCSQICAVLIWLVWGCGPSDQKLRLNAEMLYPEESWTYADPAELGFNELQLQEAINYLRSESFEDGVEELLIIKNGSIIFQGDSTFKVHNIYSCSKSFTSTVLGLLLDQGKLTLDTRVSEIDSSLASLYPKATFRHFVTMTSGYSAVGRSRWNDENADWSWTPYTADTAHFPPGSHFEYWDEAQMTLGKLLTMVLQEPMQEFLKREMTEKMQFGDWSWLSEQEVNSIPINNGCTNVQVSAQQLARMGHLFLNEGNWNGKQLISKEWVKQATSPQVAAEIPVFAGDRAQVRGSGSYGFNWWVNSSDGLSNLPDAPMGTAYMSGFNHNVCFIIPEWDMVIVRMGDDGNPPDGKHVIWNNFLNLIGQAMVGY